MARSPLALTELYRQKASAFGGQALLLVVDQFEEIFRYRQKNIDEAESFINLLLRSATEDVPIYVVMTMRSDFLGNCVTSHGLPEAINRGIYLTPRLGPDQLKSIIASPLALVGGEIDPVLVSKLVNSLGSEDELPIMEHALLRMWNRARAAGRTSIEAGDFEAVCALHGERTGQARLAYTIDNHASEIYDTLSPHQQRIARQVFLALVERRDGRDVRQQQTLKQLLEVVGESERENLGAVIEAFRAEQVGFLRPPKSTPLDNEAVIDISHESLFRQWHLFRKWLDEEELDVAELREWQHRTARQIEGGSWLDESDGGRAARWRERITARGNPEVWVKRHRGPVHYKEVNQYIEESLARVTQAKVEQERLANEVKEAETRRLELEAQVQRDAPERAEVELVRVEKEKRQAQEYAELSRRKTRVARVGMIVAVIFFVITAWAAWFAFRQQIRAEVMEQDAIASELAAKAENIANRYPDRSVLLALIAWRNSHNSKAQGLIRAAYSNYSTQVVIRGYGSGINSMQISPDNTLVFTASADRTAWLWDVTSGQALHVLWGHEGEVTHGQFSPDGKMVVTASDDKTARLWEVTGGKEVHVFRVDTNRVIGAQFSPDGRMLVTVDSDAPYVVTAGVRLYYRGSARLWDVVNGKELHVLRGHEGWVTSAGFSPDGKTVVTGSGGFLGRDKTARLWDVASGQELHVLLGHEGAVWNAQFAPDGKTVVTVGDDMTARLWRCEVCRPLEELAAALRKTIGRDLTNDERRRYGVPDSILATAP